MSSAQRRGSDYDNQIAADIEAVTPQSVRAIPHRGSGNVLVPSTDVLVVTPSGQHELELKRHSISTGKRTYVDSSEFEELLAVQQYPSTRAWLGIKLTHRELVLVEVPHVGSPEEASPVVAERLPDAFEPHVTHSGSLRLTKPTTDAWPSATAGRDDAEVICTMLGLVTTE